MAEVPELLRRLLSSPAPSGYEAPAAQVWREAAGSFAELETDKLGSSIARVGEADTRPLVAVVGHIDEIGLAITHVDEKGFAYFTPIGGWDPQILVGQRLEVQTKDGPVPGVIGRKAIHLLKDDQRKKAVELDGLHLDIGAADRDEALGMIRIGDPAVVAGEPVALAGGRLVSRSMDNRLGSYVALEVARRCSEQGDRTGSVAGVAAVQEEIGLHGAITSAYKLEPDVAVVVDVTHATDPPGVDEKETGSHALGSGPVIGRGSTLSPRVFELLAETAEREEIEHTIEVSGRGTRTDADAYQISRSGIATGLVSIPLRYMHSPVEMVDLRDVEAVVELIVAFARSLPADLDLSR
jgi:putative aminopeptidase FrvX